MTATSVMIAGCAATKSGISPSEAARMIDAVPGLSSASIDHREIDQTFGSKNIVVVSADSDRAPSTDPTALAEYLIKVGYSVNQWEPSSGLQVVLSNYDGPSLVNALKSDGVNGVVQESSAPGEFFITAGILKSRYGKWPGPTPHSPSAG